MRRFCLLAFLLATLPLYGRSWSIADYSDSITVDQDGSALVTEKIACVFVGEFHGIFRDIPIEYPGPKGTNFTLYLDVVAITDDSGNKLKYESSNQNGNRHLKIYVPGAVDARREVNISYRVKNGIRHFPEFDEFYWNVTGNDWPVPIDHATAYVTLEGMTPAECGALLSDGIHQRDITSTIVDLAVRGYIKIEETSEKHLFLSSKNYMFRLMKPKSEWGKLAAHERELLEGMFSGYAELTRLAQLKNHFY